MIYPPVCPAAGIPAADRHIQNGGYALFRDGATVRSLNSNKTFVPASTIKLVTALAAIHILGSDHQFRTIFSLDKNNNMVIQGSGDPFLVSEKIASIAELLTGQGIKEANDLILDDYNFSLESFPDGSENSQNPYDVNCSALAVNFNSLPLYVVKKGKIKSPESQTPFLPLTGQLGAMLPSGPHRVNIDAFPQQTDMSNSLQYSGQLFKTIFEKHGLKINGKIKHGHLTEDSVKILDYVNDESLFNIIKACLLSSNNFIANQLYLALGVKERGYPATWQKSREVMGQFLEKELHFLPEQITMVEGSGLSTKNRITPEAMIVVLEQFRNYSTLLPTKYGTIMKSGTLPNYGVFCYAGFIPDRNNFSSFVIFLNQKINSRDQILQSMYNQ